MLLKPARPSRTFATSSNVEQTNGRREKHVYSSKMSPPFRDIDDDRDDISSVEIGRPHANPHLSFQSFEHPSHMDSELFSRHGDEDSLALDHELGLTMSTAAHHASALTLSAGLHGKHRTPGRTPDPNAEFDPERPLQPMLNNGAARELSVLDTTARSKSKSLRHAQRSQKSQEPIIVDPSAGLDRYLQTGFRPPNPAKAGSYPYMSRSHSQPGPATSENKDHSPPRLSKVLSSQFSPKRPRSAQSLHAPTNSTPSRVVASHVKAKQTKHNQSFSNLNPARQERKQTESVRFSNALHSNPLDQERPVFDPDLDNDKTPRPNRGLFMTSTPNTAQSRRPPFTNLINKDIGDMQKKSRTVYLPDVTGITAAVETPLKGSRTGYRSTDVGNPSVAAELIATLDGLQRRLLALEREHGISRRRVRELELDLQECKIETARERTKILDREQQRGDYTQRNEHERTHRVRDKLRDEDEQRYSQMVHEKKSLESFIETMRAHMTRLTSEIALHQSLIDGLRADAQAAEEVEAEVQALRAKVERLEGEVERLRTLVEDGVRERQRVKEEDSQVEMEESTSVAQVGIDLTYVTNPLDCENNMEAGSIQQASGLEDYNQQEHVDYRSEGEDYQPPDSLPGAESDPEFDRKSQPKVTVTRVKRFIHDSELARVEAEMLERRSERSASRSNPSVSSRGGDNDSGHDSSIRVHEAQESIREGSPVQWPVRHETLPSRNALAQGQASIVGDHDQRLPNIGCPKIPTPNIRGSRIERLFNSAPEHNTSTCPACMRQKIGENDDHDVEREVQERLRDIEDLEEYFAAKSRTGSSREKRRHTSRNAHSDQSPPQTALNRVIRELQDDFTHYKSVYLDLAEQYGVIDPISNVVKRNILANHLHWIIDLLERIGDHIAILYQLVNFQDKQPS